MKHPDQKIIEYIQLLKANKDKRVLIIPHVNPDGDAIGSSMALYYFFSQTNQTSIIAPSSFPEFLEWMPEAGKVLDYQKQKEEAQQLLSKADLIIIADHNAANRSGDMEEIIAKSTATKLMIDHHPEPSYPVDFQISCIKVSSTAELVFNFISSIDSSALLVKIASAIYVGIMTDTGNFMHNVHPDTFEIVSKLIALKIDRDGIYNRVFNNYSVDRMRLMGYALSEKMEVLRELNTAIMYLDKWELEKFNYRKLEPFTGFK